MVNQINRAWLRPGGWQQTARQHRQAGPRQQAGGGRGARSGRPGGR